MVGKQTTNSALRTRVLVWEGSLIDPVGGILGALVFHGVMASIHKGLGNQLGQFAVSVGIGLAGAGADSRSRRRPRSCRQGPSQPSHQRSGRTWRGMSVPSSGGWPPAASLRPPPPRRSGQSWPPRASAAHQSFCRPRSPGPWPRWPCTALLPHLLARRLGVVRPARTRPLLVGDDLWVIDLGRALQAAGLAVLMWAGRAQQREQIRQAGLERAPSELLAAATGRGARLEEITAVFLLTGEDDFNALASAILDGDAGIRVYRLALPLQAAATGRGHRRFTGSGARRMTAQMIGRAPPSAASISALSGRPRTMMMITTAIAAPMMSPKTYTHQPVKWTATISGPRVRAGFIDEPLIGLANSPSRATVDPTAIAALWPMLRPPVAVCRITLTRIVVRTISMTNARQSPPGLGIG